MKKNQKKLLYSGILILLITIIAIFGNYDTPIAQKNTIIIDNDIVKTGSNNIGELPSDFSLEGLTPLQILFFDVGQADSILISKNGQNMLIDAGKYEDGQYIAEYLKQLGITKIDYLVGTHTHEDHIGGMYKIIDEFDIEVFLLPEVDSKLNLRFYRELKASMEKKELIPTRANIGDVFNMGDATCTIKYVDNELPNNLNNSSILIEMNFSEYNYLFMGDAEKSVENNKDIIWQKIEVLKVGHHGSNTSSGEKFLNIVSPEIAIVSVGTNNRYNHPDTSVGGVVERLIAICGMHNVFRTDLNGTIYIKNVEGEHTVQFLKTNIDSKRR